MKKLFKNVGKIIAFFMLWAILGGLIDVPSEDPVIWRFWAEFVPFALIVACSWLFWILEKKRIPICGSGNLGRNLRIGMVAGTLWICVPVLILYFVHVITFDGRNSVPMLAVWFVSCFLNVIMQELLVRGYIYQLLKEEYNLAAAIIVTTVFFTIMHAGAFEEGVIPVLCVVTMSFSMTAAMEYGHSIVLPIILHTIWNLVGAIVFNVVGLADDYPHILNAAFSGSRMITGGNCLIEGSIVVLGVNIFLTGLFVILGRKDAECR